MSETIRFPFNRAIPPSLPAETSQIITILPATAGALAVGGAQSYVSIAPWKIVGVQSTESPFTCVVIEFSANVAGIVGDGETDLIGLYGQINLVTTPTSAAQRKRQLLAVLGLNLGLTMPQIPIVQQAAAALDFVGFSQVVANVAAYDALSIGGVTGDVTLPENLTLTVVARPIRRKDFIG